MEGRLASQTEKTLQTLLQGFINTKRLCRIILSTQKYASVTPTHSPWTK